MGRSSVWPWYSPLSGYTVVVTPGSEPAQEVRWMINSCLFCLDADSALAQLTNNHGFSDFHRGCHRTLPSEIKAYHNKEMILKKEVMVNTRAQTHKHTHPFQFSLSGPVALSRSVGKIPASWCKFALILDLKCNICFQNNVACLSLRITIPRKYVLSSCN